MPSALVQVPPFAPLTFTLTFCIGAPRLSVTVPVAVPVVLPDWAEATEWKINNAANKGMSRSCKHEKSLFICSRVLIVFLKVAI